MNQTNIFRILGALLMNDGAGLHDPPPPPANVSLSPTHSLPTEDDLTRALCQRPRSTSTHCAVEVNPETKNKARSPRLRPPIGPYVLISRDLKSEGGGPYPRVVLVRPNTKNCLIAQLARPSAPSNDDENSIETPRKIEEACFLQSDLCFNSFSFHAPNFGNFEKRER